MSVKTAPGFKVKGALVGATTFLLFFFQAFLLIDGTNILMMNFTSWSASAVSLPITVGGYIAIVTTFFIGTWLIKHKASGLMLMLLLLSGAATIGLAFSANSYALYFACIVVINITMAALVIIGVAICNNWFVATRGRMLGIVTIGMPFSTAVMVPVIARLLAVMGFQTIYIALGVVLLVFGLVAWRLVPNTPEEVGLHADGADEPAFADVGDNGATSKWSLSALLKCKKFWLVMMAFGLMMLVSNCVMPLLIPRFLEIDIDQSVALNLMTIAAVVGIPLSYIWGWVDDKFGTKIACITLAIGFTLMSVAMIFSSSGNMVIVGLAVIGIACVTGGSPNLNPSMISNVFGASEYLNINRYMNIGQSILRLFALVLMNGILDLTGSYTPGYVVCCVLSIISLVCFVAIKKRYSETRN